MKEFSTKEMQIIFLTNFKQIKLTYNYIIKYNCDCTLEAPKNVYYIYISQLIFIFIFCNLCMYIFSNLLHEKK